MAQVKYSAVVAGASGKVGGNVFARNKSGAYVRQWAKPTNPNTVRQSEVRTMLAGSASAWRGLTPAQQAGWDTLAATVTRTNRLGEAYTPTGRQIFIESFMNLTKTFITPLTNAPLEFSGPDYEVAGTYTAEETVAGTLSTFELSVNPAMADTTVVVQATKPFTSPKGNYTNDYRQLNGYAPSATIDLLTDYGTAFGTAMPVGSVIAVRMALLNKLTGVQSPWAYDTLTVALAA